MQLLQQFDANQFDPTQGAGSLPIGKHPVIIEASEVKGNKAGDGGLVQFTLRIIDGPMQGTTGAYRLNLYHSNAQTVEIAHKQLSAICHVIGVFNVSDTSQMHNIPFVIEVGPQKNDPTYTEVKKVFDMNGNEPGKNNGAAHTAQPQQQQQQQTNQQPVQGQQAGNGAQWAQGNGGGNPNPAGATQGGQQWGQQAQGGQANPNPNPAGGNPNGGGGNQWAQGQQGQQGNNGGQAGGAAPWGNRG